MMGARFALAVVFVAILFSLQGAHTAQEPFRRDPGHPQWHHNSFQDHRDTVRKMTHELLHSRAQVRVHFHVFSFSIAFALSSSFTGVPSFLRELIPHFVEGQAFFLV